MGRIDETGKLLPDIFRHAQLLQGEGALLLLQDAHHHPFAVVGGQGGDPDIDHAPPQAQADAPVLGNALLGDVQAGQHLGPSGNAPGQGRRRLHHIPQDAVHPKPDDDAGLKRFDVNVGGPLLDGLGHHRVQQADDGGVVLAIQQIGGFRQLSGSRLQIDDGIQILHRVRRRAGAFEGALQSVVEKALGDHHRPEPGAEFGLPLQPGAPVHIGAHPDHSGLFLLVRGQHPQAARRAETIAARQLPIQLVQIGPGFMGPA